MKIKVKILSFLLAVLMLAAVLPIGSVAATTGGETSYTKNKVVSVLFDNSGSMEGERWDYARYALQTLMATLGKNDTLIITPMNKKKSWDVVEKYDDPNVVEVNLRAENRDAEISRVMQQTFLGTSPEGGTPYKENGVAIEQLVKRYGMKTTAEISADEKSENEYFLVVLTDGAFDGCNSAKDAAKLFDDDLSRYANFQSIYIGFDRDSFDLSQEPNLKDKANFAAYKAPDTASIGDVMRSVANRITGRFPLDIAVDPNSTTVRIPLSDIDFSLRTVTVMATNTNARFLSASYNGSPVSAGHSAAFDTTTNAMKGGFTTVISRGSNAAFSGGEIVLTLDEAPGANAVVSVLLEPALMLEPVIEVDKNGVRTEVDATYINSSMKKGDTVYFNYRIVEQGTGNVIDPSMIGGSATARVTYNTKSYAPLDPITLVEGKKEVGISVTMLGGQYSLYASFPCVVLENPTFFRIEHGDIAIKNTTTYETTFTVYNQNAPLASLAALEAFSPEVTVTEENGNAYSNFGVRKNANGTFTVTLNLAGKEYGTYTVHASVKDTEGNPRSVDVPIGYYPTGLTLTSTGAETVSKTLHGILGNTDAYVFELTAQETAIPFGNALLTYKLTVGGVDVTKHATVNGNVLTYAPTAKTLGDLGNRIGEYDVILEATFRGAQTETVKSNGDIQHKLVLTDTIFEVVPLEPTGKVDRFALGDNPSTISFKILRDGVPLSADELQAALDDGTLYLDHSSYSSVISPVKAEISITSVGGAAVLTVLPTGGHFAPLRGLVTSMLVFGNSFDMDVHYRDVSAVGVISLMEASIFSYVWRVLLILYIIQLIYVALTYFVFKNAVVRVPKGVLVSIPLEKSESHEKKLKPAKKSKPRETQITIVGVVTEKDRLQLGRLLPFIGVLFKNFKRKEVKISDMTLCGDRDKPTSAFTSGTATGEINKDGIIRDAVISAKTAGSLSPDTTWTVDNKSVTVKETPKNTEETSAIELNGSQGLYAPETRTLYLFLAD